MSRESDFTLTPIARPAANPAGDIACDITIATPDARSGLDALATHLRDVRAIDGGIAATFSLEAADAVRQYIDLESRCCSFLSLAARETEGAVMLEVTGGAAAQEWIRNIFPPSKQTTK